MPFRECRKRAREPSVHTLIHGILGNHVSVMNHMTESLPRNKNIRACKQHNLNGAYGRNLKKKKKVKFTMENKIPVCLKRCFLKASVP